MPRRQRRAKGEGSITWLTPNKVLLRAPDKKRSKTVTVSHRSHGGRGEATDALETFLADIEDEKEAAEKGWTLADAFAAYIREVTIQGKAGGTVTSYQQIEKRLSPEVLSTPVNDLTPSVIREERDRLTSTYSNGTLNTTMQVLKAVLNFAIADEQMTRANPLQALKSLKASSRKRVLTPPETFQAIRTALAADDWEVGTAIFLATVTGARRAELSGLRWEDVDVERQVIRISRQWSVGSDGKMDVHDLKSETGTDGDGQRAIYVESDALAVLAAYHRHLLEKLGREPEGWLLSYDGGTTPLKPQNLGGMVNKHLATKFPGATMHSIRRMTASELNAAGVDVTTAADRMGHTPKMFLDTYARGREDKAVEAGRLLSERLASQGFAMSELLPGGGAS